MWIGKYKMMERKSRTSNCKDFVSAHASVVKTYNSSYSYCRLRLIDAGFEDDECECDR